MQLSFFDHAMKYQGGKKSIKFLNEMKEIIPFEAIEKILITWVRHKTSINRASKRQSFKKYPLNLAKARF